MHTVYALLCFIVLSYVPIWLSATETTKTTLKNRGKYIA